MPLTASERKQRLGRGKAAGIARQLKRSEGHVSQVINGLRRDPVVEAVVAKRIGLPADEVFPPVNDGSTQVGV